MTTTKLNSVTASTFSVSFLHLSKKKILGDKWNRFYRLDVLPVTQPTASKHSQEKSSTDLIRSSSTTGLLTEGTVFPLHRLSDTNTHPTPSHTAYDKISPLALLGII